MEDRETPRMQKYGESKTTRIMMASVRHVSSEAGRTKFQVAWILLNRVYMHVQLFVAVDSVILPHYILRLKDRAIIRL